MSLPLECSLALRRRSPWEAADAGLLLWRENFVYFLPFFAVPFWICAFALRLLPEQLQYWSWLTLWLLKPFFDRLILHVVSVRFFAGSAGAAQIFRGLGRNLLRGLIGDLLWRRFSPLRAAMMPVRTLENIRRIAGRRRTLKKGGLGFCFLLTVWGLALEAALLCGEVLFIVIMAKIIQVDYRFSPGYFFTGGEFFLFTAWCINYIVTESLYVCMGFGVYLNSRVEVEGWDIELLFRRFAAGYKTKIILSAIIICAAGIAAPEKAFTQDRAAAAESAGDNDAPLETLRAILDSADFGGWRDGWGIRWKNPKQPPETGFNAAPWMKTIRHVFALILQTALLALAAALAVFLFLYLRKSKINSIALAGDSAIHALRENARESPGFLLERARFCFTNGDMRRAWGFCAAAAIRSWTVYRGLQFPANATEYDCAELARSTEPSQDAAAFAGVLNHWIQFAYGGHLPPEGSFEAAARFCESLKGSAE
ncbi:MAG: hypothetical protein LBD18_04710 [Treponema sp.]|nr:hypothetical protein [Treponema sp.]